MVNTLKSFVDKSLFDATSDLLAKLRVQFDRETAHAYDFSEFYEGPMPQYIQEATSLLSATYFIGVINDLSLQGQKEAAELSEVAEIVEHGGKYDGMFVFACEVKPEANMTRSTAAVLTRAFNRIASANPVILVLRQGKSLSLATCERMEYSQAWRNGQGEKLGKVSILRNVNCENPHRGHVDILASIGDKAYPTFEELYKHWMEVFSSELLTKKFYNELSDWYAWAVMVAKFPNDLNTAADDEKYNHEACIRLITRLIFVWFLKQKHLIPEEFFDEKYIKENFIENFDPHDKQSLMYDAEKSLYYRLILQNLFFAMLNCPIVAEGKTTANNRRFIRESFQGKNPDYGINNLMRYKKEFMDGGSEKFLKFANSYVPFLNGGLFDCLDNKGDKVFYDGFSEEQKSLEKLFLPDYLFFGEEVGNGIDLSQWYDDAKKKNVSARGIIDILKRYSFTIEENTPYDQEVSLDPELLGKVFENLLAAYNPETKQSARKQTGSFYTPREIVQYMVDESLVAHLKRLCGNELENEYRKLVNYADVDVDITDEQRSSIMKALYNCRVLDPACGSGAFPMGVLQQMVHILKRIDPTNELWNDLMIDLALADAKKEFKKAAGNEAERAKVEENKNARLADIEEAFNQNINDPDYARKLYLIEHCIYGVDIQPIATQISKLRFFISLVADQKPTTDAKTNFGIRPLPNLEAKFVTANTLIPLDREENLFTAAQEIRDYEEQLQEINHRIFLAKKNKDKERLRELMHSIRTMMAHALENQGFVSTKGFDQLVNWKMFDQNASAPFFDPEWMFGIKEGFDIVIANPPYVAIRSGSISSEDKAIYKKKYRSATGQFDLYSLFMEFGLNSLSRDGVFVMITESTFLNNKDFAALRKIIIKENTVKSISYLGETVFNTAQVDVCISVFIHTPYSPGTSMYMCHTVDDFVKKNYSKVEQASFDNEKSDYVINIKSDDFSSRIFRQMQGSGFTLGQIVDMPRGAEFGSNADFISSHYISGYHPLIVGKDIKRYSICFRDRYLLFDENNISVFKELRFYKSPKLLVQRIRNLTLKDRIVATYDDAGYVCTNTLRMILHNEDNLSKEYDLKVILAILNSDLVNYIFRTLFLNKDIYKYQLEQIPLPVINCNRFDRIKDNVTLIIEENKKEVIDESYVCHLMEIVNMMVYRIYNISYNDILTMSPETSFSSIEYESI